MSTHTRIERACLPGGAAVLLVEDVRVNQIVISRHLRHLGGRVSVAADGAIALRLLDVNRYDLVLMDCDLPDLSGYDVARRWRAAEVARAISPTPIIAISVATDIPHVSACFDAGMDGILSKPVQPEKLRDVLSLWVGPACDAVEAFDEPGLSDSSSNDISGEFEIDLRGMRRAWVGGDLELAAHFAHRLTGAFYTCGANSLAQIARCMERAFRQPSVEGVPFDECAFSALDNAFARWKARLKMGGGNK